MSRLLTTRHANRAQSAASRCLHNHLGNNPRRTPILSQRSITAWLEPAGRTAYDALSSQRSIYPAASNFFRSGASAIWRYFDRQEQKARDMSALSDSARIRQHPVVHGKPTYPANHKAAMQVPVGGSSCATCVYVTKDQKRCRNSHFQKWNGSPDLPFPADQYCSDWYEPQKGSLTNE